MNDLFQSKSNQLLTFCKSKGFVSSHDINYFGTTHYFDSATRRVREWVKEGKVRRLSNEEKIFRGFKTKCAVYCYEGN